MRNKVLSATTSLLADAAHKGNLSSMHSHVDVEAATFTEDFLAYIADVGHLAGAHFNTSGLLVSLLTG